MSAQGITTAGIRGVVHSNDEVTAEGARVVIVNKSTGLAAETQVRRGRFAFHALETGGPYTITIDRVGLVSQRRANLYLRLGQPLEVVFTMHAVAVMMDTLTAAARSWSNAKGGGFTTIEDSVLHRLPSLNRDLYDFVRLVPQISTKISFESGLSAGGVGFRFNNFLINGVSERTLFAGATTALAGGKSLPLDAVKEYQVLVAPYDVRYGDFAGALVNTVTKSGTNDFRGSAFVYARNDILTGSGDESTRDYERAHYGFSMGGPLIRDRVHFFLAPELQHFTATAEGPYLGQSNSATTTVPVAVEDLTRLTSIMASHGLQAGSAGLVQNSSPLKNIFAKLDFKFPTLNSRAAVWTNYANTVSGRFSRSADGDTFPLATYAANPISRAHMTALQLHTSWPGKVGVHNEFLVAVDARQQKTIAGVQQPVVVIALPRSTNGGTVVVNTGTNPSAQGVYSRSRTLQIANHLTVPLGASHVVTIGFSGERFSVRRGGVMGSYGTWTFTSLDSLQRGIAERYELSQDFGSASVPIAGTQFGFYAGDQWHPHERVLLTFGVRGDMLTIGTTAPYNRAVDSIFGRRTDAMRDRQIDLSPRIAVTWNIDEDGIHRIRTGIGVFTGRAPLGWLHSALASYGDGIGALTCGSRPLPLDLGPPPPFTPNYKDAPRACATGLGVKSAPLGDVNLLHPNLRMARTLRTSAAYDVQVADGVTATFEGMVTQSLSDFAFVNLNLAEPQSVASNGRVLYGTITPSGAAIPRRRSGFREVIELINTSRGRSHQLSARVEKEFVRGSSALASYTFTRVTDAQTPLRTGTRGTVNWSSRVVSGRHDDLQAETSLNDIPHRVLITGSYRINWRWPTELSFYYIGESGSPFTYRAGGSGSRGDLNADGSNANDPIYIPRSALDLSEIRFDGGNVAPPEQLDRIRIQQLAFEEFISQMPCLQKQRGQIMRRNSCREPWSNTTVASIRQLTPLGGRVLEFQVEAYNVLNLLNRKWGQRLVACIPSPSCGTSQLLEHTQQSATDVTQPVFHFDTTAPRWVTWEAESTFQLQVGVRYRF